VALGVIAKRVALDRGCPYCRTRWLRRKELRKVIIRRTERLRMNILNILVPTSRLWKLKMLKMLKVLKKIIRQNLSGLLCASTVSQTARAAI
jgi:hypothetical protein